MPTDDGRVAGLAQAIVATNFGVRDGVLTVGGLSVADLADACGTPLYVFDAALLRTAYRRLAKAVSGFAEVYYSIKANPNPAVAAVFVGEGAGLEIASAGEFDSALAAGGNPERILFAGPGKSDADLGHVVAGGIGEIHIESLAEAERLSRVAVRLGREVDVAIRVNPIATGQGGAMLMGGRPSQFGIDEERFLEAADLIAALPGLRLGGVHLFTGTQILDAEILARQWAHGLDVALRLARHLGRPLSTIDLGGGLGIPYFAGERPLDLDRVRGIADDLQASRARTPEIAGARIVIEPGRHLAGPSGVYLARVIEVKESRGERFVIVDGGMNHHLAASGNLGQVIKRDYPVIAASRMGAPGAGVAAVVGPLCTPLDTIARKTELPEVGPGDLVAVLQSGAYGLTASPLGFLSHPAPAEVLVGDGDFRLVRDRRSAPLPPPLP